MFNKIHAQLNTTIREIFQNMAEYAVLKILEDWQHALC
jgi:hypothetical protein